MTDDDPAVRCAEEIKNEDDPWLYADIIRRAMEEYARETTAPLHKDYARQAKVWKQENATLRDELATAKEQIASMAVEAKLYREHPSQQAIRNVELAEKLARCREVLGAMEPMEIEHFALLRACVELESVGILMEKWGWGNVSKGNPQREFTERIKELFVITREATALVRKRTGTALLKDGRFVGHLRDALAPWRTGDDDGEIDTPPAPDHPQ